MFGSTWCGYCPNARAALEGMQGDYGDENLVVLYYHVNDAYSTSETQARATYYNVGGTPELDWDSVSEVIGAAPEGPDSSTSPSTRPGRTTRRPS